MMKAFVGSLLLVILVGNCQALDQDKPKNYKKLDRLLSIAEFFSLRDTTLKVPDFDDVIHNKAGNVTHSSFQSTVRMSALNRQHVWKIMEKSTIRRDPFYPVLNREDYKTFQGNVDRVFFDDADFDEDGKIHRDEAYLAGAAQIGKSYLIQQFIEYFKDQREVDYDQFLKTRVYLFSPVPSKYKGAKYKYETKLDRTAFAAFMSSLYDEEHDRYEGLGNDKNYEKLRRIQGKATNGQKVLFDDVDFDGSGTLSWPEAILAIMAHNGEADFIGEVSRDEDGSKKMDKIEAFHNSKWRYQIEEYRKYFKKAKSASSDVKLHEFGILIKELIKSKG